jgi:hypothetical protein
MCGTQAKLTRRASERGTRRRAGSGGGPPLARAFWCCANGPIVAFRSAKECGFADCCTAVSDGLSCCRHWWQETRPFAERKATMLPGDVEKRNTKTRGRGECRCRSPRSRVGLVWPVCNASVNRCNEAIQIDLSLVDLLKNGIGITDAFTGSSNGAIPNGQSYGNAHPSI